MADELQALLDRLDKEGIRRGEEERERIVSKAREEAAGILSDAKEKASKMVSDAEASCAPLRQKSEESIRQSGRQVLLQVRRELESRVQGAVESLLKSELKPGVVAGIVAKLCEEYVKASGNEDRISVLVPEGELEELRAAVSAALAASLRERVVLKPDKRLSGGFKLSFGGAGQVVYDFSDEALAEALASHLSPALGALITA